MVLGHYPLVHVDPNGVGIDLSVYFKSFMVLGHYPLVHVDSNGVGIDLSVYLRVSWY